jgi:hypothetical protein
MSFLFNHGWWNPERDEQEFLGADPEPLDELDDEPPMPQPIPTTTSRPAAASPPRRRR